MPTTRIELTDGLTLELDDQQRQRLLHLLGGAEMTKPASTATSTDVVLEEGHPMWDHASGGDRRAGIEFHADDEQEARELRRGLSTKASVFFEHLLRQPGRLVSTTELIETYPEVFGSPSAVAGSLTSFSRACKRMKRSLPFYWWEGSVDTPTRYAIRPTVAQVFLRAGS